MKEAKIILELLIKVMLQAVLSNYEGLLSGSPSRHWAGSKQPSWSSLHHYNGVGKEPTPIQSTSGEMQQGAYSLQDGHSQEEQGEAGDNFFKYLFYVCARVHGHIS